MAQEFVNCTILEPFNRTAPSGFDPTAANDELVYVGSARGWGENVYKIVSNVGHNLTYRFATPQGDALIKYRLLTSSHEVAGLAPTFDSTFGVLVGSADFAGWVIYDQFYTATQQFRVEGVGSNSGVAAVTRNIAAPSNVNTYRGPRFMRVNWDNNDRTLKVKIWHYNQAEPATWQHNATNVNLGGGLQLLWSGNYFLSFDLHWVAVSNISRDPAYKAMLGASETTVYTGGNKVVTVTVRDENDMPLASSKVRLYHQFTGAFLSESTTNSMGVATFDDVKTGDFCYVIAVRPAGGDVSFNFQNRN